MCFFISAISFGVEALKSPILMLACVDRYLEPKDAVMLARLEEEFQVSFIYSTYNYINVYELIIQ